jgi:hypothetical protein
MRYAFGAFSLNHSLIRRERSTKESSPSSIWSSSQRAGIAAVKRPYRRQMAAPPDRASAGCSSQPLADLADGSPGVAAVRVDVLAGDVRDEPLETVALSIEHEARLPKMWLPSEAFAAQEQSKLERHVETRKARSRQLGPGEIVDTEATSLDQVEDLVQPVLGGVVVLERAPGEETRVMDREHHGMEDGRELLIHRAVEEDVVLVPGKLGRAGQGTDLRPAAAGRRISPLAGSPRQGSSRAAWTA